MSERTEIQPLHIGAFALAMIGGPLLVTACTFWVIFIPVFALVFGGIPYLVIGTPMALWMALTGPVTAARGAVWGGLTILSLMAGTIVGAIFTQSTAEIPAIAAIGGTSALFAMLWAGTTGWLYGALTTPKHP
jgi:XapX domain-containing protein